MKKIIERQIMARYPVHFSKNSFGVNRATLIEQPIYGACRLGMRKKDIRLYENGTSPYVIPDVKQNTLGNIAYEITNYLGNVNVVISDRKTYTSPVFKAVVLSYADYYPGACPTFRRRMLYDTWFSRNESLSGVNPEWSFSGTVGEISSRTLQSTYRYGYNGMECDDENKGSGNSYTTEFRQYDPRIGKWLSLDPMASSFPWQSPYCAFDNNPIFFSDPLGLAAEGGPGDPEGLPSNPTNEQIATAKNGQTYQYNVIDGLGTWTNYAGEVTVTGSKKRAEIGFFENVLYTVFVNSKDWQSESSFYGKGISVMTVSPPLLPTYYHPLLEDMKGTPSEDRVTSNGFMFVANEGINSNNFAYAMMGDFISGNGPENFYFGVNHSVSRAMQNSEIVFNAMKDFQSLNNGKTNGLSALNWKHYSQSKTGLALCAFGSLGEGGGSAATVENFIGGAAVKITPLRKAEDGYIIVRVSIVNVTSVGSGNTVDKASSNPRTILSKKPEKYSNISQTIEFDARVKL